MKDSNDVCAKDARNVAVFFMQKQQEWRNSAYLYGHKLGMKYANM